ncbi:MAG: NTP transferase domain-containing protein, partial [Armatimonadetes bacterium]|nr:NTP transferase domain-containing protein [Armatimonadota bacterium]
MYAVIMAGGSGTRLWPTSRETNPKQLHALVSEKPMIQETVERLTPLIRTEDMWVVTNDSYVYRIRQHLPNMPESHVVGEPFALGTTLAIGLAMLKVAQVDPQGTVVVAWSDSYISNQEAFVQALKLAEEAAQQAEGVIIGVNPTYPATGYGYIKMGSPIRNIEGGDAFWIEEFIEKPNIERAKEFAQRWEYLWNPGIAVWRVDKLLRLFERLRPREYEALKRIEPALGTKDENAALERELREIPKLAIDYTIYEKADHLAVVPADLGWSDIGTWDALKEVLPPNDGTNVVRGPEVITMDTEECLIFGDTRLVATLGVKDLVIVDTGDALLVAHRSKSQEVKEVVEKLRKEGKKHYL